MKSKPIIAVDIDDVLSNLSEEIVAYSNQKWGTDLTIDDYDEHWGEMWKVDEEEGEKRAVAINKSSFGGTLRHNPDAVTVLKKLSARFDLVVVTSRRRIMGPITQDWMDRYFKDIFSAVHFSGLWDEGGAGAVRNQGTKADLLKELNASYLIDDQPKHCIAAAQAGVTGLLFGVYPWNRQAKLPAGVHRVKNWQAVLEFFENESSR